MLKKLLLFLFICSTVALCQTSVISGTITDANGQAFVNGSYTINFVPAPGNPGPYYQKGTTNSFTQNFSGRLDSNGSFSGVIIQRNDYISPALTSWSFTVCPLSSSPCYTKVMTVTTSTLDISSLMTPPAIIVTPAGVPSAYSNSELSTAGINSFYKNLLDNNFYFCTAITNNNCSNWVGALSTGGTFNGATINSSTINNSTLTGNNIINALSPAICPTCIEGTQYLDQFASLSAAITAIGSSTTPLACTTHVSVAASITVPSNINLVAARGCLLTVASGQTLTIEGQVTAGAYPIFAGPGIISFSGNTVQPSAWIEWWGAACDGSTDDYSSLQAAFTQAGGSIPLVIPAAATCTDKTGGLTYQSGFHLEGANMRSGESSLKFEFAAGASGTVNLMAPASGQTSTNSVIRGVFLDFSNMTTTGATIVVDEDVDGNSAVRAWDHYYGPVSNHSTWGATPRIIGLDIVSASGGTSFYQTVSDSTFAQLTTDVGIYGLSGNQVNALNLTGDVFFDGNDFDGSSSCSSSPYGSAIDLGPYAASNTFSGDTWSDPVCSVILHGTTSVATGTNIIGGYVDGGVGQPWLAATDIGNNATSSYQGIIHVADVGGLPTSDGVSAYIFAPPGAAAVSSPTQNVAGGTSNGTVDTTPNTVAYLGNIGSNWGIVGGQGDQIHALSNPLGGIGDSALMEGIVSQTNAAQCDWGTLSLGSNDGAFVARCRSGATTGAEVFRASPTGAIIGAPTGGTEGAGTINTQGAFVNGSPVQYALANITTHVTVANTTTPTVLWSTSIPGGVLGTSNSVSADSQGLWSLASSPGTIILTLSYGGQTVANTAVTPATGTITNLPWDFRCRIAADESATTQFATCTARAMGTGPNYDLGIVIGGAMTVDSTIAQTLSLSWTWGTASTSNSLTFYHATVTAKQ